MKSRTKIEEGMRFGRLTVIKYAGKNKRNRGLWLCRCDCGKQSVVETNSLTSGNTRSCGCIHSEQLTERLTKHGMSNSRLYKIWTGIKRRCYKRNDMSYQYYGARGIKVCDEWKTDFNQFKKWALANGYKDNLTIDRIDYFGDYNPSNCQWITIKEQQSNKRSNHNLTFNNQTMTVTQWAELLGVKADTIFRRLYRGWSVADALMLPQGQPSGPKRKIKIQFEIDFNN